MFILAAVVVRLRSVSIEQGRFEVDTAHYVSAPQMARDAMLNKTGATLDLITDPAMYQMIQSGVRGCLCIISKRSAKANYDLVGEYNAEQPKTYISHWDAKNLYGWEMSHLLLLGQFEWFSPEEWEKINWQQLRDDEDFGHIIECALEYPAEIHEAPNA